MKVSALTGKHNYFEDFKVGEVLKHARGKTVEPLEQVWITNVTMNTAEAHFNEHLMKSSHVGPAAGLRRRHHLDVHRPRRPGHRRERAGGTRHGQDPAEGRRSITATRSIVTARCWRPSDAEQPDAGIVRFKHYGVNQDDKHIFEGERAVLIKRRSHWGDK